MRSTMTNPRQLPPSMIFSIRDETTDCFIIMQLCFQDVVSSFLGLLSCLGIPTGLKNVEMVLRGHEMIQILENYQEDLEFLFVSKNLYLAIPKNLYNKLKMLLNIWLEVTLLLSIICNPIENPILRGKHLLRTHVKHVTWIKARF